MNNNPNAVSVEVPGTVEEYLTVSNNPRPEDFRGVSWWYRKITIPANQKSKRFIVYFESVRMRAEVYLDGKLVAYDLIGETPFHVSGYKTGVWIGRELGFTDAPNAQLYEVHVDNCGNGLYVEDVNPYGILISNSSFGAGKGGNAVYFYKDFNTSVQFNGVDFNGPVVSNGSDGVVSFESCTFSGYSDYALKINSGNVLLSQCDFERNIGHGKRNGR